MNARIIAFVRWLVTLEDIRWWMNRVWTQLLDEPEERWRAARLLTQVLGAGAVSGWLIATFLSAGVGVSTVPGTTTEPLNIIAREPGVAFNVLQFCQDPTTTVGKTVMTDALAGGVRYIALRGTESVNWADSPENRNPSAMHYVTAPDGNQLGEPVTVEGKAADCMKRRAK